MFEEQGLSCVEEHPGEVGLCHLEVPTDVIRVEVTDADLTNLY